ncbi:MAG: hypothetical protein HY549_10010 [Elusimicrobia bacterium]|nr:hypothetical protein [Elusimicrobiota bacterium]
MSKKRVLQAIVAAGFLSVGMGCGNMVKTTRIVNGKEVSVWTNPENAERMKQEEQKQAAAAQAYKTAEKRQASDPIRVLLYEPTISVDLAKVAKQDQLVAQVRREFENDPVIQIVVQKPSQSAFGRFDNKPSDADVTVVTHALLEDKVGRSSTTGKAGMMKAFVLKAEISSNYSSEDRHSVEKMDHLLKNVEVTKQFGEEVRSIIKDKIGPNLPSRQAVRQIRGGKETVNLKELFKSLKRQ